MDKSAFVAALVLCFYAVTGHASITYLDSEQRVAAFGQHVYRYVVAPLTWTSALEAAGTYSWNGKIGHLATVTSLAENDFLYAAFIGPRHNTPGVNREQSQAWIALSDAQSEGTWRWMAGPELGTQASFTNWNSGEPNNVNDEDYAVIHWQDRGLGTGRWYDYGNSNDFGNIGIPGQPFLVEFEDAVNPTPIPVPASLPLLASALAGFAVWRRFVTRRA